VCVLIGVYVLLGSLVCLVSYGAVCVVLKVGLG